MSWISCCRLAVLSLLSFPGCPVLPVLSLTSFRIVLVRISCHGCPVLAILSCSCPFQTVLFGTVLSWTVFLFMSCPDWPVLIVLLNCPVMPCRSYPGSPVLAFQFSLSYPGCPVPTVLLAVLSWLYCPGCPVLAKLPMSRRKRVSRDTRKSEKRYLYGVHKWV
jgi:hypothetical protein